MKIINFTYTKETGETSARTLIVTNPPQANLSGIDVSELDPAIITLLAKEMDTAINEHFFTMRKIQEKYEVINKFRQFKPANMSGVLNDKV